MTPYVRKLLEQDLGIAEDNLYRAKSAAKSVNPSMQYGESGKTFNQIIQGYQDWVDEVKKELGLPQSAPK